MVWWVRNDPCGMFSAILTVLLILYSQMVQTIILIYPWYGFSIHIPLYTTLSVLALISHSRAQFTDPGSVPRLKLPAPVDIPTDSEDPNVERRQLVPRICKRCKTVKPYKAHHCSTCQKCIIRMDHHCPWVNNCVAIFNQKYFLLFLFYTALLCIYSGTMLVARFISCTQNLRQCSITGAQAVFTIINFVEALVFGLFVLIMMFDQCSAIFDNTPGIDALQNKKGQRRGRYESLREVFGESFSWRWFLPINLPARVMQEFDMECEHYQTDEVYAAPHHHSQSLVSSSLHTDQHDIHMPTLNDGHSHGHEHERGHEHDDPRKIR